MCANLYITYNVYAAAARYTAVGACYIIYAYIIIVCIMLYTRKQRVHEVSLAGCNDKRSRTAHKLYICIPMCTYYNIYRYYIYV